MNSARHSSPMPKDPLLSGKYLVRRSRSVRLPGVARSARRYSFFWARNAIYYGLKALGLSPGDRVLVPAYICAAAVEPVVACGAEAVFYEVQRDCQPDFGQLEAGIDARTRAVLAVHYFGFPQPIRQFRQLCDRRRIALIEDCAHVVDGDVDGQPLGTFGDASVFSWGKLLPLYDGGELILNRCQREPEVFWHREAWFFTLKVAANLLEPVLVQSRHPAARILRRGMGGLKQLLFRLAPGSRRVEKPLAVNSQSVSFDPLMVDFPMSRISRMILNRSDIPAVVAKRRKNYLYLLQGLAAVKGLRMLHPSLPAGVCPWVFPVFFDDFPEAHLPLRELGVPAVTWGGVRYPGISGEAFPHADFLYQNLIFLPIHQSLEDSDLEAVVRAVRAVRDTRPIRQTLAQPC